MSRAREIADLVGGTTPDIILKTADGAILNLQTSDTTVTDGSVLGAINFTAPNEGSGTDAITVGGAILAVAEGTFAADNNATELVFMTGASEAATSKMVLSSGGNLTVTGDVNVGANFDITGNSVTDGTALVTGVLTTTAATVFNGGFASNAASTITVTDTSEVLTLVSTDAGAGSGPGLELYRNSSSGASGDGAGKISFNAEDANSDKIRLAAIFTTMTDATNGSEDGSIHFTVMQAGTERDKLHIYSTETVFNEDSQDHDFRVESNGNANMFVVDANTDNVGVGRASPASIFEVHTATNKNIGFSDQQNEVGAVPALVAYNDDGSLTDIGMRGVTVRFASSNQERLRLGESEAVFNDGGHDCNFRIEGSGLANLFKVDAGAGSGKVGINCDPTDLFYITGQADSTAMGIKIGTNGFNAIEFDNATGSLVGRITTSASSTAYVTSSDYRLKENVTDMTGATARLKQLKPKRFNWITDDTNTLIDGFLAHEVSGVVPESVAGEKDAVHPVGHHEAGEIDPQGLDYSKLVPLLVKTIQELEVRIKAIEDA